MNAFGRSVFVLPRLWLRRLVVLLVVSPGLYAVARPANYLKKPADWYKSDEAQRIAAAVLSHQAATGGWPGEVDTTKPYEGDREKLRATFDDRATTDELRFLARMCEHNEEQAYREAFSRGLDYILQAQYANGGWPQRHPPGRNYPRYVTFNDNAMVRLMRLMGDVAHSNQYRFVDDARRQAAQASFDRGIDCILKCQVRVNGRLTVWCAQHDEVDFRPRPARTFELVSLSGSESVEITRLLMSLENPRPEVIEAIEAAVAWFEKARLAGIRVEQRADANAPRGKNKVVVHDANAPPLWARFYEIETNRPIFVDRDGVAKFQLSEISYERRNGYGWLGDWPKDLLDRDYPAWKRKLGR